MVLIKWIGLSLALLLISSVNANEARVYRQAFEAHQTQNYSTSLRILRQNYDLYNSSTPSAILLLAAFNFESLGDYPEARNLYQRLLLKRFEQQHLETVRKYNEDGHAFDLEEIPLPMAQLYERLIAVEFKLYQKNHQDLSEPQRERVEELITMYANICLENECDYDQIDQTLNELDTIKLMRSRRTFEWRRTIQLSFVSWRDRVLIKNDTETINLMSATKGPCLGGEISRGNHYWEWAMAGCLAFAKGSVSEKDSPSAEYFEGKVPVNSLLLTPSLRWRPMGPGSAVGIDLPVVYRTGDFTIPDGYEIKGNRSVNIGLGVSFHWHGERLGLFSKLHRVAGFESTMVQLGMSYAF